MVLTIFLLIAVYSDVSNLRSTNHLSIWTLVPNWWCNCRIKIKENVKIDGVWELNHLNRPSMQTWTSEGIIHCLKVLEENVKTWNFSLIQKILQRVDQVSIAYEKLIPENFCIELTYLSSFSLSLTMSTCCVIRSVAFPAVPIVTYKKKKMVKCAINKQVQKQGIISVQITRYCILIQVSWSNQKKSLDSEEKHKFYHYRIPEVLPCKTLHSRWHRCTEHIGGSINLLSIKFLTAHQKDCKLLQMSMNRI